MKTHELMGEVRRICQLVKSSGGQAFIVGGAARDIWEASTTGEPGGLVDLKDLDIEVFGMDADALELLLAANYRIDVVGKSYGVIKIHGAPIDVSVPRREKKTGPGHKDFVVEYDPAMTIREAAERRDFTFNAVYYDPLENNWEDPYGGRQDFKDRVLRPVSDRFKEDPLRVLRGMQFIARFGLDPTKECLGVCSSLSQDHLPRERVWEEWKKLLLRGKHMCKAMSFLRDIGWTARFYPELDKLIDSRQTPEWHPEGDVFTHTCLVMEAFAAGTFDDDEQKLVLGLAAICHDFGKPATARFGPTKNNQTPHWTNHGHESVLAPTEQFLARLTNETKIVEQVVEVVRHHMKPYDFVRNSADLSAYRRLACNVDIQLLAKFVAFDQGGRGPTRPVDPAIVAGFLQKAEEARVLYSKPVPLIFGRDLIALGAKPGKGLGALLDILMEKQLAGEFDTKEAGLKIATPLITS